MPIKISRLQLYLSNKTYVIIRTENPGADPEIFEEGVQLERFVIAYFTFL